MTNDPVFVRASDLAEMDDDELSRRDAERDARIDPEELALLDAGVEAGGACDEDMPAFTVSIHRRTPRVARAQREIRKRIETLRAERRNMTTEELDAALDRVLLDVAATADASHAEPLVRVAITETMDLREEAKAFDRMVADQERREMAREIGRDRARAQLRKGDGDEVPTLLTASEVGALADEKIRWRIDGWAREGDNVFVMAERKAGKTTMVAHLARCLLTGEQFLGRFDVAPATGSVVLFDMELGANSLGGLARDFGLTESDRFFALPFRGKAASFALFDDRWLRTMAEQLRRHEAEVLIVDPIGPILRAFAETENNNNEIGGVVDRLYALKERAGVRDLFYSHHAGHGDKDRARGASVLMDSPDQLWSLTRDADHARWLAAPEGRQVSQPKIKVRYHDQTVPHRLAAEGSQEELKFENAFHQLVGAVRALEDPAEPMRKTAVCTYAGIHPRDHGWFIAEATNRGVLVPVDGKYRLSAAYAG